MSDELLTITYGTAKSTGKHVSALACTKASQETCADVEFLLMYEQKGLDGISGLVGMSTGMSYRSDGQLLVKELYEAGLITYPAFGFYLSGQDDESFLDIGAL